MKTPHHRAAFFLDRDYCHIVYRVQQPVRVHLAGDETFRRLRAHLPVADHHRDGGQNHHGRLLNARHEY